ncbi:hypothetical protein BGX29_012256, partial [Mortierella sp. GBA35]
IQVQHGAEFTGQDLKLLFQRGHHLQRLHCWQTLPCISVSDFLAGPLVCTNLVQLEIQITNVPRPDITTNYLGEPLVLDQVVHSAADLDRVRDTHREIYTRLATLVNLQVLALGIRTEHDRLFCKEEGDRKLYYDPLLRIDCLDLSLERGLDLLAGLKDMRTLSVYHLDHRIGVQELRWMERNWVNLRSVAGVLRKTNAPEMPYGRPFAVDDPDVKECGVGFQLL